MKYIELSSWMKLWNRCPPIIKLGIVIFACAFILSCIVAFNNKSGSNVLYFPEVTEDKTYPEGEEI
jgi:hypothetical protein